MKQVEITSSYEKYVEKRETDFDGTIVDIETIGDFRKVAYPPNQDQDYILRYKDMKITTVGIYGGNEIQIYIAKEMNHLDQFQIKAIRIMEHVKRPTYAFNKSFEEGCYYWNSNCTLLDVDYDLQIFVGESKKSLVSKLNINNYDDPFFDDGGKCVDAFLLGNLQDIIRHNRSCLLKEHQILIIRGAKEMKTEWLDI